MAARTISATQTLEEFRTEFNALSSQDFGDIATLDSGISATSVVGAVNELYTSIAGSLAFDISDGSTTETISNAQTLTFASTPNQVTATVSATDTVTFSLPSDVTITGSFNASGTGTHSLGTIAFNGDTINSTNSSSTITIDDDVTLPTGRVLTVDSISSSTNFVDFGTKNLSSDGFFYTTLSNGGFVFEGTTVDNFETTLAAVDPTADRIITFPDETGTVVTTSSTGVITGNMIGNDTIVEANMANDAIGQDQLKNVVSLQILDSNGTVVKTMYGAGA